MEYHLNGVLVCVPISVVAAKYPEDMEVYVAETVRVVKIWLQKDGLTMANEKTELMLITCRKKTNAVKVEVGRRF